MTERPKQTELREVQVDLPPPEAQDPPVWSLPAPRPVKDVSSSTVLNPEGTPKVNDSHGVMERLIFDTTPEFPDSEKEAANGKNPEDHSDQEVVVAGESERELTDEEILREVRRNLILAYGGIPRTRRPGGR